MGGRSRPIPPLYQQRLTCTGSDPPASAGSDTSNHHLRDAPRLGYQFQIALRLARGLLHPGHE